MLAGQDPGQGVDQRCAWDQQHCLDDTQGMPPARTADAQADVEDEHDAAGALMQGRRVAAAAPVTDDGAASIFSSARNSPSVSRQASQQSVGQAGSRNMSRQPSQQRVGRPEAHELQQSIGSVGHQARARQAPANSSQPIADVLSPHVVERRHRQASDEPGHRSEQPHPPAGGVNSRWQGADLAWEDKPNGAPDNWYHGRESAPGVAPASSGDVELLRGSYHGSSGGQQTLPDAPASPRETFEDASDEVGDFSAADGRQNSHSDNAGDEGQGKDADEFEGGTAGNASGGENGGGARGARVDAAADADATEGPHMGAPADDDAMEALRRQLERYQELADCQDIFALLEEERQQASTDRQQLKAQIHAKDAALAKLRTRHQRDVDALRARFEAELAEGVRLARAARGQQQNGSSRQPPTAARNGSKAVPASLSVPLPSQQPHDALAADPALLDSVSQKGPALLSPSLADQRKLLKERSIEVAALKQSLAEQHQLQDEHSDQLRALQRSLADHEVSLSKRDGEIAALKRQVQQSSQQRDEAAEALKEQLASRSEDLTQACRTIGSLEADVANLTATVAQRDSALASAQRQVKHLQEHVAAVTGQLREAEAEIGVLLAQVKVQSQLALASGHEIGLLQEALHKHDGRHRMILESTGQAAALARAIPGGHAYAGQRLGAIDALRPHGSNADPEQRASKRKLRLTFDAAHARDGAQVP
ncbi:hypothetical protein WJX72_011856 [[Myrmecia] bisecta]|uniref:Uncharacterized protein n=1 Tax=[Myrmecia] bisecta TaxID=41462 RepID=A0AAW1QTM3_9CHLO